MPEISVVIPVYNAEKYLPSCIESVIAQNFDDYEIIGVDDGSTDSSGKILDGYAKKHSFITVVHQGNLGQAAARNIGIEKSSGKYIFFLDSDDRIKTNTLAELYENAKKNNTDIVYFDAQCVFENKNLYNAAKEKYYIRDKCYGINTGKELFAQLINDGCFTDSACLMFCRRNFLVGNGISFITGILYEDCCFSVLCFMRANVVQHINKRFYLYTVHENSTMTSSQFKCINLYSRLICFRKFSELFFSEELTNQQKFALTKFTDDIIKGSIRYIYNNIDEVEMERLFEMINVYDYLYDFSACGIAPCKIVRSFRMKAFNEKLKGSRSVTVYGAGIRSRRLYAYLRVDNLKIRVKNFLVTERDENPQFLFDLPVCSLSEKYVPSKTDLVVIAVQNKFASQITEKLESIGISNYFVIDDEMNAVIVEKIKAAFHLS